MSAVKPDVVTGFTVRVPGRRLQWYECQSKNMKPCVVQKGYGADSSSKKGSAASADFESKACAANVPTIIRTSYIKNVRASSCTSNLINKSQWSQPKAQTEVCCLRIGHASATYLNKVVSQV